MTSEIKIKNKVLLSNITQSVSHLVLRAFFLNDAILKVENRYYYILLNFAFPVNKQTSL